MLIQAQTRFQLGRDPNDRDPRMLLIRESWRQLQRSLGRLNQDRSVDAVHDARVDGRRLRALLRVLRAELHPVHYGALRFELLNVGRCLADIRNADVHLRLLRKLSATTRYVSTKDALLVIALCERRAAAARSTLQHRLLQPLWSQRLRRIDGLLSESELLLHPNRSAGDETRQVLRLQLRRVSRALRKERKAASALHRLRIRLKSAKYACEQLHSLARCQAGPVLRHLGRAQDTLGNIHDLQSLALWIDSTPIPRRAQKALLKRVTRHERKHLREFNERRPALRRFLKGMARELRTPTN